MDSTFFCFAAQCRVLVDISRWTEVAVVSFNSPLLQCFVAYLAKISGTLSQYILLQSCCWVDDHFYTMELLL